jgi:hypothetical protein
VIGQPAQRGLHERRRGLEAIVVLALPQQPREQAAHQPGRGAQPVPLVIKAQQHLGGQAHQLGVGYLRRLTGPAPGQAQGGDDAVGQLDVERGQEGVQVGDHDGLQGPDMCGNADPGHLSHLRQHPVTSRREPHMGRRSTIWTPSLGVGGELWTA